MQRAAYAGSLRRMCDTIGDIDLLVASDQPTLVIQAFTALPLVARVLARGTTKSSVITTKGIQADLRVIDPSVWGAALLYFTGSKPHNIRIRDLAARAGLKLSEYGLFEADSGRLVVAETEEQVYGRLGLPWMPPTTARTEARSRLPSRTACRSWSSSLTSAATSTCTPI